MRARPAPSAVRMASSRSRDAARASCRWATFAQAMSSTNATAADSITSESWKLSICAGATSLVLNAIPALFFAVARAVIESSSLPALA